MEGEGLLPGTFSGDVVPGGGLTGELLPLGAHWSAFWRGLLDLDSALVRSVGSQAGEGETLREGAFSLRGEGEVDVVCPLFLCLDYFFFLWEEDEKLESPSVSSAGEPGSCAWRT